jgi:hypothetical protein
MLFSSFAALTATIAWLMTFLLRRSMVGWPLAIAFAVSSGETELMGMQAWRDKASRATPSRWPFAYPVRSVGRWDRGVQPRVGRA